jgi:hypothetical protein
MENGAQVKAIEKGAANFALHPEHGQRRVGSLFDEGDEKKHDQGLANEGLRQCHA